jgi:hypothetical protein
MIFFGPNESFRIRHEILKVLFDSSQCEIDEKKPTRKLSISQVSSKTGIHKS